MPLSAAFLAIASPTLVANSTLVAVVAMSLLFEEA